MTKLKIITNKQEKETVFGKRKTQKNDAQEHILRYDGQNRTMLEGLKMERDTRKDHACNTDQAAC